MMKKVFLTLLAFAVVLSAVSCGTGEPASGVYDDFWDTPAETTEATTLSEEESEASGLKYDRKEKYSTVEAVTPEIPTYEAFTPMDASETVVNVKDFGAVGDGKTDDAAAIAKAFYYAIERLPATVYFPEGEYGLLTGGIYIYMPKGTGGLTVKGEGGDKSVIKYLDEWTTKGSWVALRIMPNGVKPQSLDMFLHDITIDGIGVRDTDPLSHAWTIEEDGVKEETHGFDIQYCIRATVQNCLLDNVGDEAIDMVFCRDSQILNNTVLNSPGAGTAGGAISVGDGCKNVLVKGNTVDGTVAADEKMNFGIAVEALENPVENIHITENDIKNVQGYAINLGAPAGTITKVYSVGNTITDCTNGIRFMGTGEKKEIVSYRDTMRNVETGIIIDGENTQNAIFDSFDIDGMTDRAINVISPSSTGTVFQNGVANNSQNRAVYNAGTDTKIYYCSFDGVGLAGKVEAPAIMQYESGSMELVGVSLTNCQNNRGIQSVQTVIDTVIEQKETVNFISIFNATTIKGGKVNRGVYKITDGGLVEGLEIRSKNPLGMHGLMLPSSKNVTVRDCLIVLPARHSVYEAGEADGNLIFCNKMNAPIKLVGAESKEYANIIH